VTRRRLLLLLGFVSALVPAHAAGGSGEPRALLEAMQRAFGRVETYTARFVRQEVVEGELRPREEALLKWQRPGRIYLRWLSGPHRGREIIYVPGREDGRMLVREPGFLTGLATFALVPDSPRVLRESRHPVTDVGLGRLIELIVANARRAAAAGELTLRDHGEAPGPAGPERRLEALLPRDPGRGYYSYRLELAVSVESSLPVRARVYDWDDRLVGDYAYLELRLNPPLGQRDFDPANPEYAFPAWTLRW